MPTSPHLRGFGIVAVCLAVTLSCLSCAGADSTSDAGDFKPSAISTLDGAHGAQGPASDHDRSVPALRYSVLAISIDGLRPAAIRRLGTDRTPVLHRLIRGGASTLNARTTVEETRTLPNHTTMVSGRRVAAHRGGHGVDVNTDPGGTVHDLAGERVASIFQVVARAGGRPALFASKSKFALFQRTWRGSIDRFAYRSDNRALTRTVRRDLTEQRRALRFLHYSAPDAAGHEHGFGSRRYRDAVAATDRRLGSLLKAIRSTPRLRGRVTMIITSDHGGTGRDHGDPRGRGNYTVPFIVWGPAVSPGTNLYRLNPSRRRPGDDQVRYAGRQPIRNGDLANLALDILGLRAVPGSQLNIRQSLDLRRY